MSNFIKESKMITQELSKEDFVILARLINTLDNEHNDNSMHTANNVDIDHNDNMRTDNHWVKDLSDVENDISYNYMELSEKTIVLLATPLLISVIDKITRKTFLDNVQELFDSVFFAGIIGLKKGIRKYDADKDSGKSIHYVIRWFDVYADRELARLESTALGVPYTRYKVLKKIAAVRIKMSDDMGRAPTNKEILQYFHSGKAELNTSNKKGQDGKMVSKSNLSITSGDIVEQERLYDSFFRSVKHISVF